MHSLDISYRKHILLHFTENVHRDNNGELLHLVLFLSKHLFSLIHVLCFTYTQ